MPHRRSLGAGAAMFAVLATSAVVPATAATTPTPTAPAPGLAVKPPMGWNTWNSFECNINEDLIKQGADAMVSSGMKAAGYEYVVVDDCWQNPERDADGNLQPHPDRFPGGMKALGDYIHSKGLKFGVYGAPLDKTCAQRNSSYPGATGSLGHEQQDAAQFAAWGADYLKYDWCSEEGDLEYQKQRFTVMRDALRATGRPIVYSINANSYHYPKTGASFNWGSIAHLWRTTEDIKPFWNSGNKNDYPMGVSNILDINGEGRIADQSGPGHWNDPDMLEVGVGTELTADENRSHFSLWSLMAAPLIAGNDIRSMTPATRDILTNPEVLAVNQDALGMGGRKAADSNGLQMWQKPLADGSYAVVLINRTSAPATVTTTARQIGLPAAASYIVRDLWTHQDGETTGTISAPLAPHASVMYRVRPATNQDKVAPMLAASIATPKYLKPGVPADLTVTFTNLGSRAVKDPAFSFTAPEGWPVQTGSGTTLRSLAAGQSHQAVWRVTPAADASGPAPFSASVIAQDASGPLAASAATSVFVVRQPAGTAQIADLPWLSSANGWGPAERNTSNGEADAGDGVPITLGGVGYAKGLGVHANSSVVVYLGGGCRTFDAVVGVDDEIGDRGSVTFELWADGRQIAATGVLTGADPGLPFTADVSGATELELRATTANDGANYDHADWADASLTCS